MFSQKYKRYLFFGANCTFVIVCYYHNSHKPKYKGRTPQTAHGAPTTLQPDLSRIRLVIGHNGPIHPDRCSLFANQAQVTPFSICCSVVRYAMCVSLASAARSLVAYSRAWPKMKQGGRRQPHIQTKGSRFHNRSMMTLREDLFAGEARFRPFEDVGVTK